MKVLSIQQPFATAIKNNDKLIETRSFKTNFRGEFLIHSSLSKTSLNNLSEKTKKLVKDYELEYGYILCKAVLVDCIKMDEQFLKEIKRNNKEYLLGHYELDRYAWILENVEILDEPIKAKGQLGFWNYDI